MSHALLLRLFLSPSFFSVHVALRYLMTYSDNIGITYYLTRRLREVTVDELRDVWGFICHLLVSRPSRSRALECFVIETARRSTHIAMLTLWFMQASLRDFPSSHNSQSFLICQRTLLMCHELIFGDLPPPTTMPYPSLNTSPNPLFTRKKVKAHPQPALVGMGMLLAGTPGLPRLTAVMAEVAIEQGRIDDQGSDLRSLQRPESDHAEGSVVPVPKQSIDEEQDDEDDVEDSPPLRSDQDPSPPGLNGGLHELDGRSMSGSSRRRFVNAARTSPSLPLPLRKQRRPRFSDDPLGQLDEPMPVLSAMTHSTPSLPFSKQAHRPGSLNAVEILLNRYDFSSQMLLLRQHFCRSEVQFMLNLESISNRLLVVPRLARVSALRAELTALNHRLPAEVCMPLWCASTDIPSQPQKIPGPHHRIVRIPPGECVVLNSAEHAPYLLVIEILHGELDFDPVKRQNKDILQKIVSKESERRGASRDLIPFTAAPSSSQYKALPNQTMSGSDSVMGKDTPEIPEALTLGYTPEAHGSSSPILDGEEEEIDLVEQLYGTEESLRSRPLDLADNIVLRPAPKNKDIDLATWSRSSSMPPTPLLIPSSSVSTANPPELQRSSSSRSQISLSQQQGTTPSWTPTQGRGLTMEDYSERMRTAAVMLSQLNANLVWEPVANPERPMNAPSKWIPGSNWFAVVAPTPNTRAGGPVHPSLAGASQDNSGASTSQAVRMKLQPSEAAAIRDRIMNEMLALEEERMQRMRQPREGEDIMRLGAIMANTSEDEGIIRRELNKVDPSAVVFSESWAAKKSRVRQESPYGHLGSSSPIQCLLALSHVTANWDCLSVIVKTGGDLRQEQLAVQLIQEFKRIWKEENCSCWARHFRILITGGSSGLVETITDAVSIHSIKKAEYARRFAEGRMGHVSLMDHFRNTYGDPSSAKFARAQRNFAKSLAGYSVITYLLQIKDRHNGNILLDREGHLVHIDFGFMLSNTPGNIGFEAAPFKMPLEYVEVLGGVEGEPLKEFRRLFREGFEAARKHCDRIVTMVELIQKDSTLPCFAAVGDQTAVQLRERFQQALTHSLADEHVERLIDTSLGSNWTRLYDSYQYYSQSILS
ncbi:kinase-like protein [Auriscalpium vulgare]|uniref:Kinase-like protein n=1 Tax=Auriscalpium vulgare TaxID=40419 RepID=A0ACB8SEB8_9AGAM|nr:kinase-like protein [Auriscalpium vulgare]